MYGSIQRRDTTWIDRAISWAKTRLKIVGSLERDWSLSDSRPVYVAGEYHPTTRTISFYGVPTLNTIFHEAVHYRQHEQGVDFKTVRAKATSRYSDAFSAYWNSWTERDARNRARQMEIAYRESIGESISQPPAPWKGGGLRSDHTYY